MDKESLFDLMFCDMAAENSTTDPNLKHILRSGVLIRLLMILEHYNAHMGTAEIDALREIRNAVVHNKNDLAGNRNSNSLQLATAYLADLQLGNIPSTHSEPLSPFFSLVGSKVQFDQGPITEHCRQIFMRVSP